MTDRRFTIRACSPARLGLPRPEQTLALVVVAAGTAALALAAMHWGGTPTDVLAMLAAAVLASELLQVPGDRASLDPADAHAVSFSAGVHLVAAVEVGPWLAALLAAFGIVVVDALRGAPALRIAYNASTLAVAACLSGFVFQALGGEVGGLDLPSDFGAVTAMAGVLYGVNALLIGTVVALSQGHPIRSVATGALLFGLAPAAGEMGFGIALSVLWQVEPWAIPALLPLVVGVYRAQQRLSRQRSETAMALETLANVIDERDVSTYRHSTRVADLVEGFASSLELTPSTVAAMRWAGRLHDLGKVSIDSTVLTKPGRLDDEEWEALRRHPRLSARLLRRYHFAASIARAVEYHHERFDGRGYYGLPGRDVPLASHFLTVADTFDAMTSDRSYRRGLGAEAALDEIERCAGTQFHPAVAHAFVAHMRGEDPRSAIEPAQLAELQRLSLRDSHRLRRVTGRLAERPELAAVPGAVALVSAGLGLHELGLAVGAGTLVLLAWHGAAHRRSRRLTRELSAAAGEARDGDELTAAVAITLARTCGPVWAALAVASGGRIVIRATSGSGPAPDHLALETLLLRDFDRETRLAEVDGADVGVPGSVIALDIGGSDQRALLVVVAAKGATRSIVTSLSRANLAVPGQPFAASAAATTVEQARLVA